MHCHRRLLNGAIPVRTYLARALLVGMLLRSVPLVAGAAAPVMVADSLTVLSQPTVVPLTDVYQVPGDTVHLIFAGRQHSQVDIYHTRLWQEAGVVTAHTDNLSQSADSSYQPQAIAHFHGELQAIFWLEHPPGRSDSVTVNMRAWSPTGWQPTQMVLPLSQGQQFQVVPEPYWMGEETHILLYTAGDPKYLWEAHYDPGTPRIVRRDTVRVDDGVDPSALHAMAFPVLWGGDVPNYQVVAVVSTEPVPVLRTWSYQPIHCGVGSCYDPWWGVSRTWGQFRTERPAMRVWQGARYLPRVGWITQAASRDSVVLLESDAFEVGGIHGTVTDWTGLVCYPLAGSDARHVALAGWREERTLVAWDATTEGNREIWLRADTVAFPPERITVHPGTDIRPAIGRLPTTDGMHQVVLCWVSDRTGAPRLWATTCQYPVGVTPESAVPMASQLRPNYPNPFNARTTIPYTIATRGHVQLTVYSLRGQIVETLVSQVQVPGEYAVAFHTTGLPSGLYLIRLRTAGETHVRKALLVN